MYFIIIPKLLTIKGSKFLLKYLTYRIIKKITKKDFGKEIKNSFIYIDFNGRCDIDTFDENDLCEGPIIDFDNKQYTSFNIANIYREKRFKQNVGNER